MSYLFGLAAAIGIAGGVCSAHDLVDMSVEIDGWTMLPFADAGATTHIIATRNDNEALATDIDVVLYEKTIDGWDGSAYDPSVTKEDALIDIATEFGLADPLGGSWQVDIDQANVLEFALPRVGFGKGFFVTDPLYAAAHQVDDPEPLAEGAEEAGLPAGSGAINTGTGIGPPTPVGGCGCTGGFCIQSGITAGADALLIDPNLTSEQIDAFIEADLQVSMGCCSERRTYGTITSAAWICSGWRFLGTDPTPGGVTCRYERDAFRLQSRSCSIRCIGEDSCTVITVTQNRIQTGIQTGSTTAATAAGCTPPTGVACVAGAFGRTHTSWSPPPPNCP